jgi:hypothetical protein
VLDCSAVRPPELYRLRPAQLGVRGTNHDDPDIEEVPIDTAIDEDWAMVAAPINFSESFVSRVIDGVQRYIANTDGVERAARASLPSLSSISAPGRQPRSTSTRPLSRPAKWVETVPASEGYRDSVTRMNGFLFIENLITHDNRVSAGLIRWERTLEDHLRDSSGEHVTRNDLVGLVLETPNPAAWSRQHVHLR